MPLFVPVTYIKIRRHSVGSLNIDRSVKAESYRVHRRQRVRELVGVESIQRDTDEKIGVLWDAEVGSRGYRRVINQGKEPSRS